MKKHADRLLQATEFVYVTMTVRVPLIQSHNESLDEAVINTASGTLIRLDTEFGPGNVSIENYSW